MPSQHPSAAQSGGAPPPGFDEAAYRRLVELSPDAMLAHAGGRVLWCNEAAAALLAVPGGATAAVGLPLLDFVAEESREAVVSRLQRMLATGAPEPTLAETFVRLDGQRVEAEVAAAPVGGGVILVVMRDVTARNRAERERRLADQHVNAFFDVTAEGMVVARDGVLVLANAAFARLLGCERPEEVVGRSVLDVVAPEERPRVLEIMRRRDAGDTAPTTYEIEVLRRDGRRSLTQVRAAAFRDGEHTYSVVAMHDVTAERAAGARLAESERRHRELFDQVPVGVWVEDLSGVRRILDALRAEGVTDLPAHLAAHPELVARCAMAVRILDVNAAACAMAGAPDKAALLASLDRVLIPESLPDFAQLLLQLAAGQREAMVEGWNGTLDGGRIWVAVRARLADGHERSWGRVLLTSLDVTERRRAQDEKVALQERLRHGEKLEAVGRLAGGVAHDFNNILAAVLGFAEASLAEAPAGSPLHENQLHIRQAALRARDLVKQILAFSRRDRPAVAPVDVARVVGEALALARAALPASVALEVRVDPAAGAVLADPTQLHQIVLNLCSNACDAVRPGGRIEVALEGQAVATAAPDLAAGDWVRLRVRDDGAGMDPGTRQRLFEPYLTTKGQTGGHGLGLAVVHGIVAAAGGTIRVETAPGRGSTFDVWLPRCPDRPPTLAPAPSAAPTLPRGAERVLLVDDEPLVLAAHRRLLQSLGYVVETCADGAQALALLRERAADFSVVITDQTMPHLSGAELAAALRAERPGTRVILCTGFSEVVDEAGAQALGLRAMLAKPVERRELALAVRRVLDEA
jgi:PAS domain S-box-containing protein